MRFSRIRQSPPPIESTNVHLSLKSTLPVDVGGQFRVPLPSTWCKRVESWLSLKSNLPDSWTGLVDLIYEGLWLSFPYWAMSLQGKWLIYDEWKFTSRDWFGVFAKWNHDILVWGGSQIEYNQIIMNFYCGIWWGSTKYSPSLVVVHILITPKENHNGMTKCMNRTLH